MKPYPDYKSSGVDWLGRVPADWNVAKLKHCSEKFFTGGTPDSGTPSFYSEQSVGVPWLMISDLTKQRSVTSSAKYISESGRASKNLSIIPAGTLLFSMYASLGTVSLLGIDATVNQAILGISPRAYLLDSEYALYFLESLKKHVVALASTSTQANLNAEKVKSLPVFLPSTKEQHSIVRVLNYIDRRIQKYISAKKKLIKLLEEQKQAIINQAVTKGLNPDVKMKPSGIEWLGEIPEHWEVRRFKFLCTRIVDCLHATPIYTDDGEYPAVRTADVSPGSLTLKSARKVSASTYEQWTQRMKPMCGDILYSREGERYGIAALVPPNTELCISQRMMVFRVSDHYCPGFIMWYLNSPQVYAQARQDVMGATAPHVNISTIRNFYLALPPRNEQDEISEWVSSLLRSTDQAKMKLQKTETFLNEYRTRVISDVVTGMIDVREIAAQLPDEDEFDFPELDDAPDEVIEDIDKTEGEVE